jgi:hypothetical protein
MLLCAKFCFYGKLLCILFFGFELSINFNIFDTQNNFFAYTLALFTNFKVKHRQIVCLQIRFPFI